MATKPRPSTRDIEVRDLETLHYPPLWDVWGAERRAPEMFRLLNPIFGSVRAAGIIEEVLPKDDA